MRGAKTMIREEVEDLIKYWEGLLSVPSPFLNPNVTERIKQTLRVLYAYLATLAK